MWSWFHETLGFLFSFCHASHSVSICFLSWMSWWAARQNQKIYGCVAASPSDWLNDFIASSTNDSVSRFYLHITYAASWSSFLHIPAFFLCDRPSCSFNCGVVRINFYTFLLNIRRFHRCLLSRKNRIHVKFRLMKFYGIVWLLQSIVDPLSVN